MTIKSIAVFIFNPIKNIEYFNTYFFLAEQISLQQNWKLTLCAKLVNTLLLISTFRYVYLAILEANSPQGQIQNALLFNAFTLMIPKSSINLVASLCAALALFYNHSLL